MPIKKFGSGVKRQGRSGYMKQTFFLGLMFVYFLTHGLTLLIRHINLFNDNNHGYILVRKYLSNHKFVCLSTCNLSFLACSSVAARTRDSPLFPRNLPSFSLEGAPSLALKYQYKPDVYNCHVCNRNYSAFSGKRSDWSCGIQDKTRSISELGYPVVQDHGK